MRRSPAEAPSPSCSTTAPTSSCRATRSSRAQEPGVLRVRPDFPGCRASTGPQARPPPAHASIRCSGALEGAGVGSWRGGRGGGGAGPGGAAAGGGAGDGGGGGGGGGEDGG